VPADSAGVYDRTVSDACELNPLALIMGLAERLRAQFEAAAAQVGLTPGQAQVLVRIEAPRRLSDLAHQQACDPSSMTTMVQRLERDGLLRRTVDPHDARARLVQPTPKGRRLRAQFLELVGDGSNIIDALPDGQRAALAGLFAARGVTV
jgi:DNA-binding MarR family transcriptional regulator